MAKHKTHQQQYRCRNYRSCSSSSCQQVFVKVATDTSVKYSCRATRRLVDTSNRIETSSASISFRSQELLERNLEMELEN
jgi:hypothetical protein